MTVQSKVQSFEKLEQKLEYFQLMQQFKVGNKWIEQQLKNEGHKTELVL